MMIEQAINEYVLWKQSHTTTAYYSYKVRLNDFEAYFDKNRELASISGNDIVQYHNKMASRGFSLTTVAYSAKILKNFFDFWRGRGQSTLNPKEIIPIKFTPKDKAVVTQEDFDDMTEILNEGYFDDIRKKLILHLLWDTGMRVSELCEMTLESIQQPNDKGLRTARVRSRKSMRYNLIVWSKKTDELMIKYLGIRLCKYPNTDYLFVSPKLKNTKLTPRTIQRWVKEIKEMALIGKDITPHSFRHGKAHNMLNKGANMRDVQAILRHVNPVSSFHYVAVNEPQYLQIASKYLI